LSTQRKRGEGGEREKTLFHHLGDVRGRKEGGNHYRRRLIVSFRILVVSRKKKKRGDQPFYKKREKRGSRTSQRSHREGENKARKIEGGGRRGKAPALPYTKEGEGGKERRIV